MKEMIATLGSILFHRHFDAIIPLGWLSFVFALQVLWICPANAYVLNHGEGPSPARWQFGVPTQAPSSSFNSTNQAIRFYLAEDAWSATNRTAELNAVRACFDQWQSVSGTRLKFEDAGLVSAATPFSTSDGTNLVYWTRPDKKVPGSRDDIGSVIALTYVSITNGVICEADLIVNGTAYEWFTDIGSVESRQQFIDSTLLHEIGHFIGLEHSPLGAATMFAFGLDGVDSQAGLSSDDISGVRALYGIPDTMNRFGSLQGVVRRAGKPVVGAVVVLEDEQGNALACGLSLIGGGYEISAIPPGRVMARVAPLDPAGARDSLTRGRDISSYFATNFVETAFVAGSGTPVVISPGAATRHDFEMEAGSAAPRITGIRIPSQEGEPSFLSSTAASVRPGTSRLVLGVYSSEFPASGGTLRISGGGLRVGSTTIEAGTGIGGRLAVVDVLADAVPGMRTLSVDWPDGTISVANGFLEIQPVIRDDNFDGLDDLFQRRYFPKFTAVEAGPLADPDGDGAPNSQELAAGTSPISKESVLRIRSVALDGSGALVRFDSVPGRTYQLQFREETDQGPWKNSGQPTRATSPETVMRDVGAGEFRYYRIQVLP